MKRLHVALAVSELAVEIDDYAKRLELQPCVVVDGTYALFRNEFVNLSFTQTSTQAGTLRHLGMEDDAAPKFSTAQDPDGVVWEHFSARQQADEINKYWPEVSYQPGPD